MGRKLDFVDECLLRQLPSTDNEPDLRDRIMNDTRKQCSTVTTIGADENSRCVLRTHSTINNPITKNKKAQNHERKTQWHGKSSTPTTDTTTSTIDSPSKSAPRNSDEDVPDGEGHL